MLLRYRLMLAAAALFGTTCDEFGSAPPAPAASASAAPPAAIADETSRLTRAAADAALAAAKTCIISAPPFDDACDECPAGEATVRALEQSASALGAHARAHASAVPGPAAAFAATVDHFAAWMRQGITYKRTRGTLRLFQDVADAWNAYRPKEAIAVDPIDEYRLIGFGSKGYIMKPMKKTDGRVVWKSCYDGPCLWENHW